MKQVFQSLSNGKTQVLDVPLPQVKPGCVLIHTSQSLISAGTEKMLVDFGKASFIDKIRQQPDKVRLVMNKIKTDGLLTTLQSVRNKLESLLPMGYCNVGKIIALGKGVTEFAIGDRVVSNGNHAEMITVPKNLCCNIPEKVTDEQVVFTILGAIALQGIRLAAPTLGESFVVIGLGLIGLLTLQLLQKQGARVIGFDLEPTKVALAKRWGLSAFVVESGEDLVAITSGWSRYRGVDGVIITAATKSHEPIRQAAEMCRQRGRIIVVGVTGLKLSRDLFYKKELTFQVSCSYGPGRYDKTYEEEGQDYPCSVGTMDSAT